MVSSTDDLNIVHVVTIDGWQADTAVVHLSSEDLISEEIVSENTAVRVSEIVGIGPGNIWKITEHGVHGVVLLVHIVEVTGVLIDSVGTEEVLEEQESNQLNSWNNLKVVDEATYDLMMKSFEKIKKELVNV